MTRRVIVLLALVGLPAWVCLATEEPIKIKPNEPTQPAVKVGTSLENLMAAYDGESNAHARYTSFAKVADEEGYGAVGSLFRAAARAEEIHARNHAEVIKKLGGEPKADIKKVEAKTTRENLQAAMEGENYERLHMYPEFIRKAKADNLPDAIRTLNFAKTAEEEHAAMFQTVLKNMDQWKAPRRDFFVCAVCGYTTSKLDFEKCVSCFAPREKYEKVN